MALHPIARDARGRWVYVVDYMPQGKAGPRLRTRLVTSTSDARAARREAEQFLADRRAERVNARAGIPAPPRTLRQAVEEYLAMAESSHRDGYTKNLRRTLMDLVRRLPGGTTANLTTDWLHGWQRERALAVKARTANRELAEISAFLAYEVSAGRLSGNATDRVAKLREDRAPAEWLRPAEYAALYRKAKSPVRDAMDVLVTTGFRLGELLRLRPEHVQAGQITVVGRKARDFLVQPAGGRLLAVLCPRLNAGTWPYLPTLLKEVVRLARRVKGLRATVKAFRHTCATWLLAMGVDVFSVRMHLGHSSVTTTEIYTHYLPGFDWGAERDKLPARTREMVEECASLLRHPVLNTTSHGLTSPVKRGAAGVPHEPTAKQRKRRKYASSAASQRPARQGVRRSARVRP